MQGEAERAVRAVFITKSISSNADSIDSAIPRPLARRQRDYDRTQRLARGGFDGELELETLGTLKVTNHLEQTARKWIPVRTEHAHQAFGGSFRDATEFLKPNRRIDVVAQNRSPSAFSCGLASCSLAHVLCREDSSSSVSR
jgi:hypothetical protein